MLSHGSQNHVVRRPATSAMPAVEEAHVAGFELGACRVDVVAHEADVGEAEVEHRRDRFGRRWARRGTR